MFLTMSNPQSYFIFVFEKKLTPIPIQITGRGFPKFHQFILVVSMYILILIVLMLYLFVVKISDVNKNE